MSIEAVEAVIDLIELGAMATKEDIVKCLRSAIAEAELPTQEELISLYTQRPPKREWVSLTDPEINFIYNTTKREVKEYWDRGMYIGFPTTLYRAIEAKFKEKNT